MKYKRIYHPTLNEFRDVPASQADAWKEQGWRFTNPGQVVAPEGGVGDDKDVTDTYPYRPGEGPAASVVAVIGPDPAAQATPPTPTATPTSTRP